MKITVDREKFLTAFQTAASVAPNRSPKPILQNVKLIASENEATLVATDMEIGIRLQVPGIVVEQAGTAMLPVGQFGSILRESSDEKLYVESDGQRTLVRGDRSQFNLPGQNPDEFPEVALFDEAEYHDVPVRLLRELIRRTVFATDIESSRYALGGVMLEMKPNKITAVATDGRRLAVMEGTALAVGGHQSVDAQTIVPTRTMQLIERALSDDDAEIQISARPNEILVKGPRVTVFSRLVEGRYPKWQEVLPAWSESNSIEMAVGPLFSALRQAAIVSREESRGIDFSFADGTLVLSSSTAEVGEARVELPISFDGAAVMITLDHRFVADFLKVLDPDKTFTLQIRDRDSAAYCSTDDGYGYVVMPLAKDRA